MKKLFLLLALVAGTVLTVSAQNEPFRIISMEDVNKTGGKCDYDTETCTARFSGSSDRWFDIPGMQGDFSEHSNIQFDVLESNVLLKFVLRYKDENGKMQQVTAATLYGQMGKTISKKKTIKLDLAGKNGEYAEILKNLAGVRVSMAKLCTDSDEDAEPLCHFGTQLIIK